MRSYYLLTFFVLSLTLLFSSCQNSDSDQIRNQARETLPAVNPNNVANTPAPAATPSFNAAEPHYVCPNNCSGGNGPAAGACPVCGTTMTHNTAYHNASANTTTPPTINMNDPASTTTAPSSAFNALEPHYKCPNNCAGGTGPGAGSCPVCGTTMAHNTAYHSQGAGSTPATPNVNIPQTTNTSSPAQNAAGVYHYTCSNGCAGGAGSAGTCATCGSTLAHNTAYHGN